MALVYDRTIAMAEKKVFLVAAFRSTKHSAESGPVTGMAEDVVAVIGMTNGHHRFEWVAGNRDESITNPALVTPVKVRLAVPSPWHSESDGIVTGLVQLAPTQLGDGTIDEDVDHLLTELAKSRGVDTPHSMTESIPEDQPGYG